MKNLATFIFAAVIAAYGCDDDNDQLTFDPQDLNYFPLEVGRQWEYERVSPESDPGSAVYTIVGKEVRNDKEYFAMERVHKYRNEFTIRDTVYYRIDSKGNVFEIFGDQNTETNRFKLGATDGYTWNMRSFDHNYKVTTTFKDLIYGTEALRECKAFDYNAPIVIDEEHYYVLAKDIGIVEHGGSLQYTYKLKAHF